MSSALEKAADDAWDQLVAEAQGLREEEELTEDDMLDPDCLFGTCDIEQRLYLRCLRDAKTVRSKGWRKFWNPEWTLVKRECIIEAKDLELCTLHTGWRKRIVHEACQEVGMTYSACVSLVSEMQRKGAMDGSPRLVHAKNQAPAVETALAMKDCLDPFKEFMGCARAAIEQRHFENNFTLT